MTHAVIPNIPGNAGSAIEKLFLNHKTFASLDLLHDFFRWQLDLLDGMISHPVMGWNATEVSNTSGLRHDYALFAFRLPPLANGDYGQLYERRQ